MSSFWKLDHDHLCSSLWGHGTVLFFCFFQSHSINITVGHATCRCFLWTYHCSIHNISNVQESPGGLLMWRKPPTVEQLQDKGAGVGHLGYQGISGTVQREHGEQSKPEQQTGLTRERSARAVVSEVGFSTKQHQRCFAGGAGVLLSVWRARPAQEIPLIWSDN